MTDRKRPLRLHRSTIRTLTSPELRTAQGGEDDVDRVTHGPTGCDSANCPNSNKPECQNCLPGDPRCATNEYSCDC